MLYKYCLPIMTLKFVSEKVKLLILIPKNIIYYSVYDLSYIKQLYNRI